MAERGKWYFDNSNELILARLDLVPDFKPKSEFFKNLDVGCWHHHWELSAVAEIRRVFVYLYGRFKSFAGWAVRWERLVPHKKAAICFFYVVLIRYILGYLRDVVARSINRKATLTNLSDVEVELSKNRVFFHLIDCLLPPLQRSHFLFMFLKLRLLLKFYVVVFVCFLFWVPHLEIDLNVKSARQLQLSLCFSVLALLLWRLFLFLIFFLRVDFSFGSSSNSFIFLFFVWNFSEKLDLGLQLESTRHLHLGHRHSSWSQLVLNKHTEVSIWPLIQSLIANKEFKRRRVVELKGTLRS